MDELVEMGRDDFGRGVLLTYTPDFAALARLEAPTHPFSLFVGADVSEAHSSEALSNVISAIVAKNPSEVLWWGPGCELADEMLDESAVGDGTSPVPLVTTSHAGQSILEALEFAAGATPVEGSQCLIVAFIGNVHWYNEAQNCLEDLLGRNAG